MKKPLSLTKKLLIFIPSYILGMFLIFYFTLPFLNFTDTGFYIYLVLFIIGILVLLYIINKNIISDKIVMNKFINVRYDKAYIAKLWAACALTFLSAVVLILIFSFFGTKLVSAKAYYEQLPITEGTEEELLETFDFGDGEVLLPIIDKDLAYKLAQASLGDYGAQYTIDYDNFTLISVKRNDKSELVRIAPLEYTNFFVACSKYNEGSIGYIEVNVVTKETTLHKVNGGMKYMPSGIFGRDLDRYIRFHYPGTLYTEINFEIDDKGDPYWIIPTEKKEIGVISGETSSGVIKLNPVTGEIEKFARGEEPEWIDRVVRSNLVGEQATNALMYKNGFMNVHFGSKEDVFRLSNGYNYFIKNGNTYYVSCITSPNETDQTSIGFITVNLKTREATKYMVSGITETRAREIAMNDARVKAQKLDATWPILINYEGVETYFLVLKNEVQEQKMVFVNVKNGSLIAMGNNMHEAKAEYDKLLANAGEVNSEEKTFSGIVTDVRDLVDTIEFRISGVAEDMYFVVNPKLNTNARFLKVGDNITVKVKDYQTYYYVIDLTKN